MPTTPATADFSDLDALLTQAVAQRIERTRVEVAKSRKGSQLRTREEVEEDNEVLRRWEAAHEWRQVANVALFLEQECSRCGDFQYLLQGLFTREEHRHVKGTRRWQPAETQKTDLNSEIMLQHRVVPFCGECCDKVGFSFSRAYYQEQDPDEALAVAAEVEAEAADSLETPWPFKD